MKIAVPVRENGQIDDHFGHCEYYAIFELNEDKKVVQSQYLKSVNGCGCKSNIARDLANQGVEIMLAGGIGMGAIHVLNAAGIQVVRGCSGDARENVQLYAEGKIEDNGEICQHHEHHHGHGHEN